MTGVISQQENCNWNIYHSVLKSEYRLNENDEVCRVWALTAIAVSRHFICQMSLFTTPHKPGILPLGITPIKRQGEKTFVSGSRIVFHRFRGDVSAVRTWTYWRKERKRKRESMMRQRQMKSQDRAVSWHSAGERCLSDTMIKTMTLKWTHCGIMSPDVSCNFSLQAGSHRLAVHQQAVSVYCLVKVHYIPHG